MAAAAVNYGLMSRGCVKTVLAAPQQSGGVDSCSGSNQLVWDPLHRRQATLRVSCRSPSYLSSSSVCSSSIALGGKFAEAVRRRSGLRLAAPRASTRGDGETEQKGTEIDSEVRAESNVVKSSLSESSESVWSRIANTAAQPAVLAMMIAVLLAQPAEDAFAASSGGRMGGKSFSKPSAPSRSYSGGGGGGGRSYSGGGGGVYIAPPLYGSPYGLSPFGYSPFYGGGYGGGFLGPPIGFGGGGTIVLAMIAFATVRSVIGFIRDRFTGDDDSDRFDD